MHQCFMVSFVVFYFRSHLIDIICFAQRLLNPCFTSTDLQRIISIVNGAGISSRFVVFNVTVGITFKCHNHPLHTVLVGESTNQPLHDLCIGQSTI